MQSPADATAPNVLVTHFPLVKRIAHQMARRYPESVDVDDLISIGVLGLIDSLDRYDASKSCSFETYARIRIQGAIVDALRKDDWVPRSVRNRARTLDDAAAKLRRRFGREPSASELAAAMGISEADLADLRGDSQILSLVSLDEPVGEDGGQRVVDRVADDETPGEALSRKDAARVVRDVVDRLPERDRLVVRLYYFEDLSLKEIGAILGVTESRVSQIHSRVKQTLEGRLSEVIAA